MKRSPAGISLIETLLALGIMTAVLAVIVSSFMMVMIRSAKVRILKGLDEDGKYALRVIEQRLRTANKVIGNSSGLDCPGASSPMVYIRIEDVDGEKTEIGCLNGGTTAGRLVIMEGENMILGNETLVGRLTTPEVKVDSCSFVCTPGQLEEPDRIDLAFRLSQAEISSRVEEQAVMDFQTTVILRNF